VKTGANNPTDVMVPTAGSMVMVTRLNWRMLTARMTF
jgi:hypothetical protein